MPIGTGCPAIDQVDRSDVGGKALCTSRSCLISMPMICSNGGRTVLTNSSAPLYSPTIPLRAQLGSKGFHPVQLRTFVWSLRRLERCVEVKDNPWRAVLAPGAVGALELLLGAGSCDSRRSAEVVSQARRGRCRTNRSARSPPAAAHPRFEGQRSSSHRSNSTRIPSSGNKASRMRFISLTTPCMASRSRCTSPGEATKIR